MLYWAHGYLSMMGLKSILVSKRAPVNWPIISLSNGFFPVWCQDITWTNILSIVPSVTHIDEILFRIQIYSIKKMLLNLSSANCWPFCWDLNVFSMGDLTLTLRPRQDGRRFQMDFLEWIFLNEIIWISIKMSLKFVPCDPINNIPALVQIMAWRQPGDKPLSGAMMVSFQYGWLDINRSTAVSWH